MKRFITSLFVLGCLTCSTNAQIINVPGDQPSIQAGINAALDGDTVLVADSTYYENIDFRGKAITVASHFLMDGDTSHISNTIIDGSQPSHPDTASVVRMISGEDTTSVLCGFTITGGKGSYTFYVDAYYTSGGGIQVFNAGGKIIHNIIEGNNPTEPGQGSGNYGFGIAAWINNNHTCIIRNNTVRNNTFTGAARGIAPGMCLGGGRLIVEGNTISGNTANSETEAIGGGITYWMTSDEGVIPKVIIRNNRIFGNEVEANNIPSSGGGIFMNALNLPLDIRIYNNLIYDNHVNGSGGRGGGIEMWDIKPVIYNNTIMNNQADLGNQLGLSNHSEVSLFNNIIWSDGDDCTNEIFIQEESVLHAVYNLICGDWPGEGNIDTLPDFVPGSFALKEGSPAIGNGKDSVEINGNWYHAPLRDLNDSIRPHPVDNLVDIGAMESPFIWTYDPTVGIHEYSHTASHDNVHLYPIPFTTQLMIETNDGQPIQKVEIISLEGRLLSILDNIRKNQVTVDRTGLTSGVYIFRVYTEEIYVRKVLVE